MATAPPSVQIHAHTTLRNVIIGACITGALTLGVNFFITTSSLRQSLSEQRHLQMTRTLNSVVLMRDELVRTQEAIKAGLLDLTVIDGKLSRPKARWPTQMWSTLRWSPDFLNFDTVVIKSLSSLYDDIYFIDSLRESVDETLKVSAGMEPLLSALRVEAAAGRAPASFRDIDKMPAGIQDTVRTYDAAKQHLANRLPDVLSSLEIAIRSLQSSLDR